MGVLVNMLCITEDFASSVSVYKATGYAVAMAFDCSNDRYWPRAANAANAANAARRMPPWLVQKSSRSRGEKSHFSEFERCELLISVD